MTEIVAILVKVLAIVTTLMGMVGTLDARVSALEHGAVSAVGQTFGAVSVLSSPLQVDGSETYMGRVAVRSANSNLANFRVVATSTPEVIMCNIVNGANAATYVVGWGATAGATTTIITSRDIAANTAFNLSATSTLTSISVGLGGTDGVLPPGFVNVRTTRGDNTMSGTCTFKAMR